MADLLAVCRVRSDRHSIAALTSLCLVFAAASPVAAAGVRLLSIHDLTVSAAAIVVGTIASAVAEWSETRAQIFTQVELEPEELLKGAVSSRPLSLVQPGGRVGTEGHMVAKASSFPVGKRVLVFLARRRDGRLGVVGLFQGKFDVEWDLASGREMAVRHAPGSGQIIDQMTLDQLRSEVKTALAH